MTIKYVPIHIMCEYKQQSVNTYSEPPNITSRCGKKADAVVTLSNSDMHLEYDYEEAVDSPLNADFIGANGHPTEMILASVGSVVLCEEHAEEVVNNVDGWKYDDEVDPEDLRIPSIPKRVADRLDNVPLKDDADID